MGDSVPRKPLKGLMPKKGKDVDLPREGSVYDPKNPNYKKIRDTPERHAEPWEQVNRLRPMAKKRNDWLGFNS